MSMFPYGNSNCLTKKNTHLKEHTVDMEVKHVNKNISIAHIM